jgi:two-component system sensor histidine kinase/response regulator
MDPSQKRILIVDDTQENIQVLGAVLKQQGFLINVAMGGRQALEKVNQVRPDLILLDITMPDLNGFEVCQALKEDGDLRDVPVIFLSALADPADISHAFDVGGVDYVVKPFNATELLHRVRTHLRMRELQENLQKRVEELGDAVDTISRMARENETLLRHELSNAIGPIQGYVDMMAREVDADRDVRRNQIHRISQGVTTLQELLHAIRDLQAIEYGRTSLNQTPVDLVAMVREEIAAQEATAGRKISIAFRSQSEQVIVEADTMFLPGVFRNLIKNAVEHVQALDPSEQKLSVALGEVDDGVGIVVANGGPPIPEELLPHFFEKFNSTKKGSGGTGLGTSYAYTVVTAHGGRMSVSSSAEEGTRVRVWLPKTAPLADHSSDPA